MVKREEELMCWKELCGFEQLKGEAWGDRF